MLAGEPPFTGPNAQAVIAKRMSQPAPSVRVVRHGVHEALDKVLRRALSRAPADRYRTAEVMRHALETAEEERMKAVDFATHRASSRDVNRSTPKERARRSESIESIAVLPFENLPEIPSRIILLPACRTRSSASLPRLKHFE